MKNRTTIASIASSAFLSFLLFSCAQPEQIQPENKQLYDAVFASGSIILDNDYTVTANTEGYLTDAFVSEGDSVKANAQLFRISNNVQSEQLANAKVNYQDALNGLQPTAPAKVQLQLQIEQATHQLKVDQKNFERYQKLQQTGAVSQQEFDKVSLTFENSKRNVVIAEKALADYNEKAQLNVKNAETQLIVQQESNKDYYLSSLINGIVLQTFKEEGELVRRGEAIAKVGGGMPLIKLYIAEEDINRVFVGQKAWISLNTDKTKAYEAKVSKLYPSFDLAEQSFIVEAQFAEMQPRLFANTQLQANIIIDQKEDALVIPNQYLTKDNQVYTVNKEYKSVEVGIRSDEWVEVISGLTENDVLLKPSKL